MSVSSTSRRLPRLSRRVRRALLLVVGVWFVGCCVLAVVVYGYGLTDRAQPADVIVVLGAGLEADLSPGPALTRRAVRAAELWHAGYAPQLICAGGYATWASRSEADGCAEVLRAHGVPAAAIVVEDASRSTEENAYYAHAIMNAHGWQTALVVSDGYHLLRATWIFSAQGITFSTATAAPPPFLALVVAVAREVVAFHWQVFSNLLGLPVTYVPWW